MYYLDSSSLIKIYIDETGSEWMRAVRERAASDETLTCEISGAEVFAAFHRRFRAGDLTGEELQIACHLFKQDVDGFFTRLPVTKGIVDSSMTLIQKYPLRGYDAIQLTTALSFFNELSQVNGELLNFVSADKILNDAARSEGLTVINPSEQK